MRPAITVASNYGRFVVGMASVAIVTPRAIAAIGMQQFGVWSLASATCGFITLLELGIATTSMRFAAESEGAGERGRRDARLSTLLVAQLPIALAMMAAGWLGATPMARVFGLSGSAATEFTRIVHLGATVAAAVLPLSLWRAALAARGHLHLSNLADAGSIAAGAAVSLAGLAAGLGATALALGAGTTLLLPAPLLHAALRRRVPDLRLSWRHASLGEWRAMRNFAAAAVSSNGANLASQRLEPVLVNAYLPLGAVGQYSIAARIAEYAVLLGRQLSGALTPMVARAHGAGDAGTVRATLLTGTVFQMALVLPFALLLGWHAPAILHAWIGTSAEGAALPLRLLCVALALAALAMNPAICLGMTGRHRLVAHAALGGAALRLAAGALLLGPLGLAGVGLAAIASAAIVDVGVVVTRACRHVGIPLGAFFAQAVAPVLPGLLAAAAVSAALERWQPPLSLPAVFAQSAVAGAAFVALFVPCVLRRSPAWRTRAAVPYAREAAAS
ncbi:MAG: oligosaccharide flippase family protein [Steroidobacteraceae bacterium]